MGLGQDLRLALRSIVRNPGFSAVVVLTLALGIGANTAIFSLMDAVVLRPLAVPNPGELWRVYDDGPSPDGARAGNAIADIYSWPLIQQFDKGLPAGASLTAMTAPTQLNVRVGVTPAATRVLSQLVSGSYFSTFGVVPAFGRLFTPDDSRTLGGHPVVVVGYGFWQRQLAADPSAVGKSLEINGALFTIVGIAPAEFRGNWTDSVVQLWVPLVMQDAIGYRSNAATSNTNVDDPWPTNPRVAWLNVVVRADASQRASAGQSLAGLYAASMKQLVAEDGEPPYALERRLKTESYARGYSAVRDQYSSVLGILMTLVTLLLLVACASVANLLLARWAARQREVAIRLAIGAGRAQLIRQLLTEALVLAALGGMGGLAIANWTSAAIASSVLARNVLPANIALDGRVLAFCAIASIATSLIFGVLPALRGTSTRVSEALKTGGAGSRHVAVAMRPLVAAQVALSVVLVMAAALFGRSLLNLWNLDPGYDRQHIVQIRIDPLAGGLQEDELDPAYRRVTERARQVPGVKAAEVARLGLAAGSRSIGSIALEGYTPAEGEVVRFTGNWVGPSYFTTTGMRLVDGRAFTEHDVDGQPRVAVINETAARRYFNGSQGAIGKRIDTGGSVTSGSIDDTSFQVVGVVADARVNGLREAPLPMAFYPLAQAGRLAQAVEVRVDGDAIAIGETVRRIINAEEPRLLANGRATLVADQLEQGLTRDRLVAYLAGGFGGTALLLACVGLYGVLAYAVARRRSEMGLRMALGARPADVTRLVLGDGLRVASAGILLGVAATFASKNLIESLLFGVTSTDVLSYAAVIVTLLATALLSSYIPARRASRVNPMTALRTE